MENFQDYDLPSWVLENEEDFPFGAKATPFLPSATELDIASQNVKFELPEWMECREILGLENDVPFEGAALVPSGFKETHENEDTFPPIRPEDMLVPLSQLQPQSAPQVAATPALKTIEPIPKVIICKKIVKNEHGKLFEIKHDNAHNIQVCSDTSSAAQSLHLEPDANSGSVEEYEISVSSEESFGKLVGDEWIDDMFQMIGKGSGNANYDSTHNINFSSELVESNMEDLLSQLESTDSLHEVSDDSSWVSEPGSPVSLPSPVPSVGHLSPYQASSESLFASPVSPSVSEDYNDNLGAHSYSRSPLKRKLHSKSSARKLPYPESRKDRKKEQNKQAALRYRQKKKQEEDDLASRIKSEEKRQEELKTKYASLKQELGYLKKLMREVFIAKGVISADAFKKK